MPDDSASVESPAVMQFDSDYQRALFHAQQLLGNKTIDSFVIAVGGDDSLVRLSGSHPDVSMEHEQLVLFGKVLRDFAAERELSIEDIAQEAVERYDDDVRNETTDD